MQTKIRALMRYLAATAVLVLLAFLTNFILAESGTAENAEKNFARPKVNTLLEKIVTHRDFFIRYDGHGLDKYEESLLCDVNDELGEGNLGILLLEPPGFLRSVVFKRDSVTKIHESMSIPRKDTRDNLARNGIAMADARFLAENIVGLQEQSQEIQHQAEQSKEKDQRPNTAKRPRARNTKSRREAMPQTLPFVPDQSETQKSADRRKLLEQWREEVSRNPELSSMKSEEILQAIRTRIEEKNEVKRP